MSPEVHGLPEFYASAMGLVAARRLRERLIAIWPDLRGRNVLGLGWTAPYLGLWQAEAQRCLSLVPPQIEATRWPAQHPMVMAEEETLPFPDRSMDRVLLVHGLEAAENGRRMMREVWRVLADDGRVLVVAPNRRGLWAHLEKTPFGQGQPYSMGQLRRLLKRQLFTIEQHDTALYIPPFGPRPLMRGSRLWERMGKAVAPRLAGLVMIEASKSVWAAVPASEAKSPARRLVVVGDRAWPRHHAPGLRAARQQEGETDERPDT
ncbi:methyltransferase domain-containing protein [Acetobacteraceae bacterium H6797]|nr:methyltransferase domain-containing protein [Acetobacteraceae bacterium H6797]